MTNDKFSKIIKKHRKEAVITCSEDCWCWELEEALNLDNFENNPYHEIQDISEEDLKKHILSLSIKDPEKLLVDLILINCKAYHVIEGILNKSEYKI